jgi:opacity protein-like surface antigen
VKHALPTLCITLVLGLQLTPAVAAQDDRENPLVQVFLGVLELDDQTSQWNNSSGEDVNVDFSSLPSGGIEAEFIFGRGFVHWGLNPGGSIAWKSDNTNISGALTQQNGGTLLVELDNALLLTEVHLGAYVRGRLGARVTTYAAAGPMVLYGSLDVKNDTVTDAQQQPTDSNADIPDSSSSDVNLGYYARAGIDFEIEDKQHLGLGVRYLSSDLDFDQTAGKLDIKGPQYVLTFTVQL